MYGGDLDRIPSRHLEEEGFGEGSARAISLAGLPALTGAPEDVEAAAPVRAALVVAADDAMTELRSDATLAAPMADHPLVDVAAAALNALRDQADAAWWLANRDRDAATLLAEFARQVRAGYGGTTAALPAQEI